MHLRSHIPMRKPTQILTETQKEHADPIARITYTPNQKSMQTHWNCSSRFSQFLHTDINYICISFVSLFLSAQMHSNCNSDTGLVQVLFSVGHHVLAHAICDKLRHNELLEETLVHVRRHQLQRVVSQGTHVVS